MTPSTNRLEGLQTLKDANLDGAFANAFATLCGGTFMVGFVKHLGGSDFYIGLLTAIPSLLGLLQIPGAILGRSFSSFKTYVTPGGWGWRAFHLPFVALPLLALSSDIKLNIMVACVTLASAMVMMVGPIYNDWLAELVPPSSRGWFFSRRNAILAAVGTGTGLLGGIILDAMRNSGRPDLGFALVYGLGLLCALISMIFYLRMKDIPRINPVKQSLRNGLLAFRMPIEDRRFRTVLIFLILFGFGQTFPGNLFGAYALESLNLPFTIILLCGATQALGSIVLGPMWGYVTDKYGNRPLLMLAGLGIALTPVCWMLTRPNDIWWNTTVLLLGHLYSGVVWGGVSVCQFNIILATADAKDRAPYLGVGMATQALIGGIGPLVGAQVMAISRSSVGAYEAYHVIFWATLILRVVSIFFLLPVKEPGSIGIRETIKKLRTISPGGYAALRTLNRSNDPSSRGAAIAKVASSGFSLATEEIISALHDPSPKVRRQAAKALGKMGEDTATQALIHQLDDHPDLVEEETIEALSLLGGADAVEPLITHLQSPRSSLRRAAARALGRIGDRRAIPELMRAADDPSDPDLRRAALQALRQLEAFEAHDVIRKALGDERPSVRIAAAEAVAELDLSSCREDLRESMLRYPDEAASELAYALGCVGNESDIPLILREASKCVSMITRRRTLLGIARLLNVEAQVYPIFMCDGLARDTVIVDMMGPAMKKNQRIRLAVGKYSGGDEEEALRVLAHARLDPNLELLLEPFVEETFLVAAAFSALRSFHDRS